jgi:peptidoglycan/LPS O-acetylase OafA/YrhL
MKDQMISASSFRTDINGLRAWAVVAVIFYHFGIPGFSGGFSGVDIFFVISGLLMTGIIVTGLEREASTGKKFSVLAFYWARASRIFPALIALCAVLLIMGWFLLPMMDYQALGKQVRDSLTFVSNIQFWRAAGYFDTTSHEKWLLHTWSLSVEWQFYLLLPLVLLAVWKLRPGRKPLFIIALLILLVSFSASIFTTKSSPSTAFYLLHTRAWEMLAGGLVYLIGSRFQLTSRQRIAIETVGFGLIIATLVLLDISTPWPGWQALFPVVGTSLVLLAARNQSMWTAHPIAQWLGTRSYSIYLWHWPVAVALTFLEQQSNPSAIALGLALTLVLAWLSYTLAESPARKKLGQYQFRTGVAVLLGITILVILPGQLIWKKNGIAGRFAPAIDIASSEYMNRNPRFSECFMLTGVASPSCMYGGDKLRAVLMGDSHADAVTTALAAAVPDASGGIMGWTYTGCPILLGVKNISSQIGPECGKFVDWAEKKLAGMPKDVPLVIVNRSSIYPLGFNEAWEAETNRPLVYFSKLHRTSDPEFLKEFTEKLVETSCTFAKERPVYLIRPIPEMAIDVPKAMARAMVLGKNADISISLEEYHRRHHFIWKAQDEAHARCGVKILDPLPYLCHDGRCYASKDGRPLYFDDDHLSEYGNKLLIPMFQQVFNKNP